MPLGIAGVEEQRPAAMLIDCDCCRGIGGEELADRPSVTEDGGRVDAGRGDVRMRCEDRGCFETAALNRRRHECLRQPFRRTGAGIDADLQPRPACKPQFPGNHQLSCRQGSVGLAAQGRTAGSSDPERLDLRYGRHHAAPWLDGATGRGSVDRERSRHGVFLQRLRSADQAEEEAPAIGSSDSEVDSVLPADPVASSGRHGGL